MSTEAVRVVVRARPLNKSEKEQGNFSIVDFDRSINQVAITEAKTKLVKTFAYDAVFDDSYSQQQLYDESAFPLVDSALQGYNSTIFAYGQTGCGKTYTMLGIATDPILRGIIPNSFSHIFGCISEAPPDKVFLVRCSYIEIYNEEVRDLLKYDPNVRLELKESKKQGIFVKNLSILTVKSIADIGIAMDKGNAHRIVKATNMNETSSRSHAIFTIYIETSESKGDKELIRAGKLNLVDLAGSERQKKTGAEGDRLKEAIKINLSLSALGNVINALVESSQHIPYRDSKLTLLLQDSLGGNTKTLMIAVISPADYNYDESLSTLRYASRAKFIQNKPKVNEDPKDALLRKYALEIIELKKMLEMQNSGEPIVIEKIVERFVEVPVKKKASVVYEDDFEEIIEDPELTLKRKSIREISRRASKKLTKNPSAIKIVVSNDENERGSQITRMMTELKNQFIKGGEELEEAEKERLKAQKIYRKKLKKKKAKEIKLIEESKKQEEEALAIEKKYESLQEELEDLRKLSKQLKVRCKAATAEVNDINNEFAKEKEVILDSLRSKQADYNFLTLMAHQILPRSQIRTIKEKSKYDQINKKWKIPAFVIQDKSAFFTKVGSAQVRDAMQDKVVRFKENSTAMKKEKNLKQNYFSDQSEQRPGGIEDKKLIYLGNKLPDKWSNIATTEEPFKQKKFLQPIRPGKRFK